MKLATMPPAAPVASPAPSPAVDGAVRRSPSSLNVPSLEDGSASASASLDQVASYVGMLKAALVDDPNFYARLVKRGFLDSAIDYAKYAYAVVDYDQHVNNDGFKGIIEGAVLEALVAARDMGTPAIAEPNLADELAMAAAAATNAARGLQALVTGH
ncbi:MAG: hypothetical protein JWM86_1464 [Thermoleophilia bacterium]|nr:hypothetical protein [Thermoleophilia bacterium]